LALSVRFDGIAMIVTDKRENGQKWSVMAMFPPVLLILIPANSVRFGHTDIKRPNKVESGQK